MFTPKFSVLIKKIHGMVDKFNGDFLFFFTSGDYIKNEFIYLYTKLLLYGSIDLIY